MLALATAHGAGLVAGRGGIDRLTAQDIMAALAMAALDADHEAYVLAYATDEATHRTAWRNHCLSRTRAEAQRNCWEERQHRITRFGLLVYVDGLGTNRCQACNGAGIHKNQKTCAQCDGSGLQPTTPDWHASRMEIKRTAWDERWQSRYDTAMATLATWRDQADSILRHLRTI